MKNKHTVIIPIGDWSADGHEMNTNVWIKADYDNVTLRQAYKDSCKMTGLQFNHNENYSGLPEHSKYGTSRHICTEYQQNYLSDTVVDIFKGYSCPFKEVLEKESIDSVDEFLQVLLWFIGLSLPTEVKYEVRKKSEGTQLPIAQRKNVLNGYWNEELNTQFGYGIYEAY